jgi:guanylate kinase
MSDAAGTLFVVSAPSGTGKTTLVERLVATTPNLVRSTSYTSRPARPGEADGVDYNFIERQTFEAMAARGEFLEYADVFGNLYGTSAADTERELRAGHDLVLVIDVQGAMRVRRSGRETVGIFILPPSFETLSARLRGRCQDSDAAIARRLIVARDEVAAYAEYDYVLINDDLERSLEGLRAIVRAERARLGRMRPAVALVLRRFGQARDEQAGADRKCP